MELKRDMIVRGTLESVDAGMGLTLTDVVFENVEVGINLLPQPHPGSNFNVMAEVQSEVGDHPCSRKPG